MSHVVFYFLQKISLWPRYSIHLLQSYRSDRLLAEHMRIPCLRDDELVRELRCSRLVLLYQNIILLSLVQTLCRTRLQKVVRACRQANLRKLVFLCTDLLSPGSLWVHIALVANI